MGKSTSAECSPVVIVAITMVKTMPHSESRAIVKGVLRVAAWLDA